MSKTLIEDDRTGLDEQTIRRAFIDHLQFTLGKTPDTATASDCYSALSHTVRDRIMARWIATQQTYRKKNVKTVGYLSAEFLLGPHLHNHLLNMQLTDTVRAALKKINVSLDTIINQEEEPGLGNGGLGRLAACFLDSLATLDLPAIGYGIRYEFGIFDQLIQNGWQVEMTDKWLRKGNPWEVIQSDDSVYVQFGGHTEMHTDEKGNLKVNWIANDTILGVPYDTPITGYATNTVGILRLWKSEAHESFDFHSFNEGNYYGAVADKVTSENISKVLYPNDEQMGGKELRLKQQYFFVSCSLQDAIRRHIKQGNAIKDFHKKFTLQLNDTHPAIAIAELMRLLVDVWSLSWTDAWAITTQTFGYTNHTLLSEALEKWSLDLFARLLPRHVEIIYEINQRFLDVVKKKFPNDNEKLSRLSLIDEAGGKYIRMANLACVGSYSINGVAYLHSELVKQTLFPDLYALWPEKFSNKTNGVTPRRWLMLINPELSSLISSAIGEEWRKDLSLLKKLEPLSKDKAFREKWRACKLSVKKQLANEIAIRCGETIDPSSLFDVQVKRIHEYKRQHLAVLHIITLYQRLKKNPKLNVPPRTFIFGGKAAPGYRMAKLIIKLINSVREVVNNDSAVNKKMKVIFIPDFNVTNSRLIYPAAELSEQISMAGKEASGTGNMKFMMNGALTIGTLDGANVEIREEAGDENFFLFGRTVEEINALKKSGYHPQDWYAQDAELKECIDAIQNGLFSPQQKGLFQDIVNNLLHHDPYFLLADYRSYMDCQDKVNQAYQDQEKWTAMSILNTARSAKFSSDRTILEYAKDIWQVSPVTIPLPPYNADEFDKVKFKDYEDTSKVRMVV